jgi:hypothetical protein
MTRFWMMVCAMVLGTTGCAEDAATGIAPVVEVRVDSRWNLHEVNGKGMPAILVVENAVRTYESGQITIEPDGTWTLRYDLRDDNGVRTIGATGTYTVREGDSRAVLFIDLNTREISTGTVAGTTLHITMGGMHFVFERTQ